MHVGCFLMELWVSYSNVCSDVGLVLHLSLVYTV